MQPSEGFGDKKSLFLKVKLDLSKETKDCAMIK